MDALNALRAVLVGCAFVATLILATRGQWIPATVLTLGILAHLLLFGHQRVERRRRAERLAALEG
ncbi:MAG: hypothetical protein WD575_04325 [Nitriliruptoraceae bacterium]